MTWTPPKITLIYAGILAIFYFFLTVNVIRVRWMEKVGLGYKDDPKSKLFRAVRIHGNFAEFVPFTLLLLALDEMTGRSVMVVHILGCLTLTARLFHYIGITQSAYVSWGRSSSVLIMNVVLLILAVFLLMKGLS